MNSSLKEVKKSTLVKKADPKEEKEVLDYLKLQIKAKQFDSSPGVVKALEAHNLDVMNFRRAFNLATQRQERGTVMHVTVTVYADNTFAYTIDPPPILGLMT